MPLQIGEAISDGFRRTVRRNGLLLIGAFVGFGLINAVVAQSLTAALRSMTNQAGTVTQVPGLQSPTALAVPIPWPVAAAMLVLFAFVAEALRVVGVRVFAGSQTQTVPEEATRDLPSTVLNSFLANVLTALGVTFGLILLVFPGVYLAMALFFVRQEVAVGGDNAVDALSTSWERTKGHRLTLFGLALILFVIGLGASTPGFLVRFVSPTVGAVVSVVLNSAISVFGIAVVTRAYEQLRGPDERYI
jgi:hypothetical protein